ncbi:MAG: hypothetical protein JNJ54_15245 [Myxococcaceae bacterium]|nr:hypothetical protein [Myxococcaceae bacterium]
MLANRREALDLLERRLKAEPNFWTEVTFVLALYRWHESRGEQPPERLDARLQVACEVRAPLTRLVREVVAAWPGDRRDRTLFALPLPEWVEVEPAMWGRMVAQRYDGWSFLDLAADRGEAARRAVRAIAAWQGRPPWKQERPAREALRVLAALGVEAKTAIDEALGNAAPAGREVLEVARRALDKGMRRK